MIFALSGGVPSVATWVRIDPSVGGTPVSPPSSPPANTTNTTGLTPGLYHFNNVGRAGCADYLSTSDCTQNAADVYDFGKPAVEGKGYCWMPCRLS